MPAVLSLQPCRILFPCALWRLRASEGPGQAVQKYLQNLLMQLGALKDAVRQMAEAKDAAATQSAGPVREQLQVL